MLSERMYEKYVSLLRKELVPALGCTEPIAVAFAASKARKILGRMPEKVELYCSGNIIKNVMGVTVPNSDGLKGIESAALLGIVGGDPEAGLQVLQSVNDEHRALTRVLLQKNICTTKLLKSKENLHIISILKAADHEVLVEIMSSHTHIVRIESDGVVVFTQSKIMNIEEDDNIFSHMSVKNILQFADSVQIADVRDMLDAQIVLNKAISDEGLKNDWGANVGKTLIDAFGKCIRNRAIASAAAGSDARMSGCSLPVIINSGSGNQGMTVSLPVIEYARELGINDDKLYRALVISNLISILQKHQVGRLSAYCGAVSAAAGSGAGIAYLYGFGIDEISATITNTIANVGGIVCDGAKPSCAAKIASSVDAAIMGFEMSRKDRTFSSGEGLVKNNVDRTIESISRMGREGMKDTDIEILIIMIEESQKN